MFHSIRLNVFCIRNSVRYPLKIQIFKIIYEYSRVRVVGRSKSEMFVELLRLRSAKCLTLHLSRFRNLYSFFSTPKYKKSIKII